MLPYRIDRLTVVLVRQKNWCIRGKNFMDHTIKHMHRRHMFRRSAISKNNDGRRFCNDAENSMLDACISSSKAAELMQKKSINFFGKYNLHTSKMIVFLNWSLLSVVTSSDSIWFAGTWTRQRQHMVYCIYHKHEIIIQLHLSLTSSNLSSYQNLSSSQIVRCHSSWQSLLHTLCSIR